MATTYPIYLVGGSKGGVGKSFVSLALADYLQRRDLPVALVETDTSNPDVMKAIQDEVPCIAYSLDEAEGWIGLVNFCDERRDAAIVVNTAARSQPGIARFGATLASTLGELRRELVVLWVINRQRDSLELLRAFSPTFPEATIHVVRNGHFGTPDKFTLYQASQLRKTIEARGRTLDFPDLADRVADELRSQRMSIRVASETMHIGERAELLRWRSLCDTIFSTMIDHAGTDDEP